MQLAAFSLVIGAAASGKSAFAERLASARGPSVYIATAEPGDSEMRAKIAAHRARRGDGWRTLEAPRDLDGALAEVAPGEAALIDCATLWLANLLAAGGDVDAETDRLLAAIAAADAPVVMVTNELGAGLVPASAEARRFRNLHGALNQRLAAEAGLVVSVVAGLPLALKGTLQAGVA